MACIKHDPYREAKGLATRSFYEYLVLRTPESVRNLEKAIELADERGPLVLEGTKGISDNPEYARRAIGRARMMKEFIDD